MGDPFRDELQGALARIAHLEGENAVLRLKLDAERRARVSRTNGGARPRTPITMTVLVATLVAGALSGLTLSKPTPPAPADLRALQGIATAALPVGPPVARPAKDPSAARAATSGSVRGCRCAPGDPLCACF